MKEYEYVVMGIEEFLCDQLVSVICQENFDNESYVHGFRRIVDEYRKLHQEYGDRMEVLSNPDFEETEKEKFKKECIEKRENILSKFVQGLDEQHNNIDVVGIKNTYLEQLQKEDYISLGKRVYIYPYIISQVRKVEMEKREVQCND